MFCNLCKLLLTIESNDILDHKNDLLYRFSWKSNTHYLKTRKETYQTEALQVHQYCKLKFYNYIKTIKNNLIKTMSNQ